MRQVNRRRVLLSGILAAAVAVAPAAPGENTNSKNDSAGAEEEVVPLDADVTPPKLIHQVRPRYVPGSRGVRVVGAVVLEFIVSSTGIPRNVTVIRSLDKDIDQSAVEAVEQWRFEPAKKAGKAVAVKMSAEIRFNEM